MMWPTIQKAFVGIGISAVVVLATAQVSTSKRASLDRGTVSHAIERWESKNPHVQLDAAATNKLAGDISKDKDIEASPTLYSASGHPAAKRADVLVGAYLSDLRDAKYEKTSSPKLTELELTSGDVEQYSFADYLKNLQQQAILKDPGLLTVTSVPPGADIRIDGAKRGLTNKDFVVSRGGHAILVKAEKTTCSDNVDVEGDPVLYKCPK